jgi:hydroxymethylpyrimidine pyrophosphatase-like HAD family hydrolase
VAIRALATDYDGTIATHGVVPDATVEALRRFKTSGGKLLMITGRELPDLKQVFPHLGLFDAVVVENGALLYRPDRDEEELLAPAPPAAFLDELRRRNVEPLAVGRWFPATLAGQKSPFWQADRHRKAVYTQFMGGTQPFDFVKNYKFTTLNNENVWAKAMNRVVSEKVPVEQAVDELIARIKQVAG